MSTIIATTLSNGSVSVPTATVVNGSAKAWVNFNDLGTATINNSLNITSVTDYGTGQYTLTFTNSFDNHHYAAVGNAELGSTDLAFEIRTTATTHYDMWISVGAAQVNDGISDASSVVTGDLT